MPWHHLDTELWTYKSQWLKSLENHALASKKIKEIQKGPIRGMQLVWCIISSKSNSGGRLHSEPGPRVRFLQTSLVAKTCHPLHPSPVCWEAVPAGRPPPAARRGWQSRSNDTALCCCGTAGSITQLTSIKTNRAALLKAACVFLELCIGKDSLSHPPPLHIPLHLSINSQKPLEPARKASCLCSPMQISLLPIY